MVGRGYSEIVDKHTEYTCTPVHEQTAGQQYDGMLDKWAVTSEDPVPRPGSTGRPLNLRRINYYLFIYFSFIYCRQICHP